MTEISIRRATSKDIPKLTELAVDTYVDSFGHSFAPADLAAHLACNLAPANVERFVAEDVVLVAEREEQMIGYIHFGAAGTGYAPTSSDDQELRRLYVRRQFQGEGVGTLLMQAALAHPQLERAPTIYLDVWEHNPGAQRFYQRHGFEVVSTRPFEVESGAATSLDLIMARRTSACGLNELG